MVLTLVVIVAGVAGSVRHDVTAAMLLVVAMTLHRADSVFCWPFAHACSGRKVSPWFQLIQRKLLPSWWAALQAGTLSTLVEEDVIHRDDVA